MTRHEIAPTTAWTEIQVDDDGITITLLTESDDGAAVEDATRYSFDELEQNAGLIDSLNPSDKTRELWNEQAANALKAQALATEPQSENQSEPQSEDALTVGTVVSDKNPPQWSTDARVEIIEVLPSVNANEYVIQGENAGTVKSRGNQHWTDETVADANPSYPTNDTVVLAKYVAGDDTEYAFPASRLGE